jgi:hypothetical protein
MYDVVAGEIFLIGQIRNVNASTVIKVTVPAGVTSDVLGNANEGEPSGVCRLWERFHVVQCCQLGLSWSCPQAEFREQRLQQWGSSSSI